MELLRSQLDQGRTRESAEQGRDLKWSQIQQRIVLVLRAADTLAYYWKARRDPMYALSLEPCHRDRCSSEVSIDLF